MDLQEELNQKDQTIKQLEEERNILIQNANELQTNQIALEKEITRQKSNIANYEAELIELHKERNSCDEQIQKSQIQIESYEQQITLLNEDLKKVTIQCDEALQKLQEIQSRHEIENKTLIDQLMNEKEKINEINDDYQLIVNSKQGEIDLLNEKLNNIEETIQTNLKNYKIEIDQLNNQIELTKQEKDNEWEQSVKLLQNEIDDLNKALYEKEQTNKFEQKIEELNQYIIEQEQQYMKQFETQEGKVKKLQDEINILNDQILELQKTNENQIQDITTLQQELIHKNENCQTLTQQLEDLKQQFQLQQQQQQKQTHQPNQNNNNLQGQNSNTADKMVTIPMKELLSWDKRSKDQQNQIKALSNENQLLKNSQEEQQKLQNSKQMKSNLSLEGMVQKCTALQQIIDETSQQNSKITQELNTYKLQNQQLKDDLHNIQQELKELRVIAQDKFRLEGELASACIQISENKDLMNKLSELSSNYENKEEQLETTKKTLRQSEQLRNNLQIKFDEISLQYQKVSQELINVKQERDQKIIKLKDLEKLLQSQFQEYSHLEQKYKDSQINYEDMQSQVKILGKKYSHETEQLKDDCLQKQKQISALEESNKCLTNDLLAIRELQFRQKAPEAPLTKKEKIVVESLSLRVQELELENRKIRDSLCAKIVQLQNELEQKTNYINQIAHQISKQIPSLQEQDLLDKEDVKMIQQLKKKVNIQEILEKTLVENLQLRDQIKLLGTEINKRK